MLAFEAVTMCKASTNIAIRESDSVSQPNVLKRDVVVLHVSSLMKKECSPVSAFQNTEAST